MIRASSDLIVEGWIRGFDLGSPNEYFDVCSGFKLEMTKNDTSWSSTPTRPYFASTVDKLQVHHEKSTHSVFFLRQLKQMASNQSNNPAQDPDTDSPTNRGHQLAQFGAGCFWGVELAFQRLEGGVKTEVGYSQGLVHKPNYNLVCTGTTKHSEVVRLEFDPSVCSYNNLLSLFWSRHDPSTLNRQQGDVGTQYRSGIYYYNEEQARLAKESLVEKQKDFKNKIVTEILPAKRFYRAEEYHQQYLAKGGRAGSKQSSAKGCNDPIRCYG